MFLGLAVQRFIPSLPRRWLTGLAPARRTVQQRLADLPLDGVPVERPVTIRWNQHLVPYIEAETDRDLAVALGLIQGHLRMGQIELMRLASQGRLSEVFGFFARDIDHALRLFDFEGQARRIRDTVGPDVLEWVDGFAAGLNHQAVNAKTLPPDLRLLRHRPAPWTPLEVMTLSRITSADFNWVTMFALLSHYEKPGFARLWSRLCEAGAEPPEMPGEEEVQQVFDTLLRSTGRVGSNSYAVSAGRSATGAALMASDPHLGLTLPNLWLLVGVRSPSYNLVGLMLPGTPIFGIGRNPDLAWGGTNLRAASSDLFDVSALPASQFEEREVTIKARFGRSVRRKLRSTPFGPVLSDSKLVRAPTGRTLALRWVGQEATDELGALLKVARARSAVEFREALATFAVPAQNYLCADSAGSVGHALAAQLPERPGFPPRSLIRDAADPDQHWGRLHSAIDLPYRLDPPEGIVVSANDQPPPTAVPVGFLYASPDRVQRLREVLLGNDRMTIGELMRLQRDTVSPAAETINRGLIAAIREAGLGELEPELMGRLENWNGDYAVHSQGAPAFEALLGHLLPRFYKGADQEVLHDQFGQWNAVVRFLLDDLRARAPEQRHALLREILPLAARDAARYPTWGDMHRLPLIHFLGKVPLIGRAFTAKDLPSGGSRQTPMKSSHGIVTRRHRTGFGSMGRHVSDMGDVDANWFCLLGGQDGWLGSDGALDQVPLWQEGRYIRMPLRPESVAKEFPLVTLLQPAGKPPR